MKVTYSAVVLLLVAAACGSSEPPARSPETPPAPSSSSMVPAAGTSLEESPPPREGVSSLASSHTGINDSPMVGPSTDNAPATESNRSAALTDEQILYVLHAANIGEMDQARMATKQAKNGRVKRFANMMLKDHGEADAKGNDVAKKVRASLSPSDVSNRLENDAKQLSSVMTGKKGADFDRSYIDAQVKEHRAVLESIDRVLLPAVHAADVKELVQTVRAKVEGHLKEAEEIQKGLGG
jgi:putative membrane protein